MNITRQTIINEIETSKKYIVNALAMENPKFEFSKMETKSKGSDYIIQITSKRWYVLLHIRDYCKNQDLNDIRQIDYWVEIKNGFGASLFYRDEQFGTVSELTFGLKPHTTHYKKKIVRLREWIKATMTQFLSLKIKDPIKFYFGDSGVKVLGDIGISVSSMAAFEVDLRGLLSLRDDVLIYKIKHRDCDGDGLSYSYAIFHNFFGFITDYSWWSLFPDFCGEGRGTSSAILEQIDALIKSCSKEKRIEVVEIELKVKDIVDAFVKEVAQNTMDMNEIAQNIKVIKKVSILEEIKEKVERMETKLDETKKNTEDIKEMNLEIFNKINEKNIQQIVKTALHQIKEKESNSALEKIKGMGDNVQRIDAFIKWVKIATPFAKRIIHVIILSL